MQFVKQFLTSKQGKRAMWTILNSLISMAVATVAFAATDNIAWAVSILPFAQALSQWFTKEIINPKIN